MKYIFTKHRIAVSSSNDLSAKGDIIGENETVLHIQCPWRIIKGKKLLIGSRDIYETLPDINYDEWDVFGNSLFDKYLEEDF